MELELITYDRLLPEFGIKDSRATIARKMKQEPPKFPLSVKISESRIGWYRHEIKAHVENLMRGNAVNFRAAKKKSDDEDDA
jgi:predicted DNA-binding transcriptional regulator AlpA